MGIHHGHARLGLVGGLQVRLDRLGARGSGTSGDGGPPFSEPPRLLLGGLTRPQGTPGPPRMRSLKIGGCFFRASFKFRGAFLGMERPILGVRLFPLKTLPEKGPKKTHPNV